MNLNGKHCLVTGGSRGIGKTIALELAKRGADVAITYARSEEAANEVADQIKKDGGNALAFKADATEYARAEEVIGAVVDEWSGLDVVVNNAGITADNLILRMSEEQWDSVITTNLKSVFNYSKAAAKPMMRNKGGSVINISSVVGLAGNAGQCNYSASKAGIIGFTKSFAKEFASRNIRSNVVAPGYITTEMTGKLSDEILENIRKETPLGRAGESVEVANMVSFLASDLSSYITGEVFRVDGGMAM